MALRGIIILFLVVTAAGCNKFEDDPVYHGTIKNSLNQSVHLDFYKTQEDYNSNVNVLRSVVVPPGGSFEVPSDFEGGTRLYLDWYTDDYLYTNWGLGDVSFNIANITPDMDPVMTVSERFTYMRRILLNGQGTVVRWKAIDARLGMHNEAPSYWNSLTAVQKDREIVLNKNLRGTYIYKDAAGNQQQMVFSYYPSGSGSSLPTMYILFDASGAGSSSAMTPVYYPSGSPFSLDTLAASTYFPPEFGAGVYNYFYTRVE